MTGMYRTALIIQKYKKKEIVLYAVRPSVNEATKFRTFYEKISPKLMDYYGMGYIRNGQLSKTKKCSFVWDYYNTITWDLQSAKNDTRMRRTWNRLSFLRIPIKEKSISLS